MTIQIFTKDNQKLFVNQQVISTLRVVPLPTNPLTYGIDCVILPGKSIFIKVDDKGSFETRQEAEQALENFVDTLPQSQVYLVVAELPEAGLPNKIYLVPSSDPETQNTLDEFIWVNNDWEKIGSVSVDLSDYFNKTEINSMLNDKVDKVSGMGLSSNDFTTTEKNKLSGIQAGAQVNAVTTVAGRTGAVVLAKADVGLGSVQNYAIASKTQAESGTSNDLYMTPLRTKELITVVMGDIESALDAILGV